MLDYETLLKKILDKRPELSREEIEKRIERMLSESPLLTREGALLYILSEIGEKLDENLNYPLVKIKNLTTGLRNVNLVGRVLAVRYHNLPSGRLMARVKLGDETGKTEVVCWDDACNQLREQKITAGDVVKLQAGYVRENRRTGELEVHLSKLGHIQKTENKKVPDLVAFYPRLGEAMKMRSEKIDFVAVVLDVERAREVGVKDVKMALVELVLGDGVDAYYANLWLEQEDTTPELRRFDVILVSDAWRRDDGITLTSRTQILKLNPSESLYASGLLEEARRMLKDSLRFYVVDVTNDTAILYDGASLARASLSEPVSRSWCIELHDVIKVRHRGRMYLHYGRIRKLPNDKCSDIARTPNRVGLRDIKDEAHDIVVRGYITGKTPLSKADTRFGPRNVIQFWLKEGEFSISCLAWGDKAVELDKIPDGAYVELRWINVRRNRFNELEIRVDSDSVVEVLENRVFR